MSFASSRNDAGMILINVLLIVALAASVVVLMTSAEDVSLERSLRLSEAARAAAIARGGELSAVAALRRAAGDPRADLAAIGQVSQRAVHIEGGSFALRIDDAQARFNLATVRPTDAQSLATALRVGRAEGVASADMTRIVVAVAHDASLSPLADAVIARASRYATLLPVATRVNLNSADAGLLAALASDPATATRMIALRGRRGTVTGNDLSAAGLVLPPSLQLGSDLYWVRSRASIGGTVQQLTSLLFRRYRSGRPEVIVIGRWWGQTGPIEGPPP